MNESFCVETDNLDVATAVLYSCIHHVVTLQVKFELFQCMETLKPLASD